MTEFDNSGNEQNFEENEINELNDANKSIQNIPETIDAESTQDDIEAVLSKDASDTEPVEEYKDEQKESEFSDDEEYIDVEETDEDSENTLDKDVSNTIKRFASKKLRDFRMLNPAKRKKYIIIASIVTILFVLVITDIIPILPNSYHRSYVGNSYTLGETLGSDTKAYGNSVLYASNGSLLCFGPDMKLEYKIDTFQGVPTIRTNKKGVIVFCRGGYDAFVMSDRNNYKVVSGDEAIISASVNEKSDYVIVTSEMGYSACVSAYSSNHESIYKWHTNNTVIDTAISPSTKRIVAATVDHSDTAIYGKLVFLDTAQKTPLKELELKDNIISELYFPDENTIIAIGNSYTVAYTATGNQKWKIDYEGKLLKTFDISDEGNIAFLFNRYNSELSESGIELYGTDGKKTGSYDSKSNVRGISVNNNYCLLSLDKQTVLIDNDGDVKKAVDRSVDYQYIVLYNNYNFAFGVNDNIAEILSVRH